MSFNKTLTIGLLAVAAVCAKDFSGAELYTLKEYEYGKYEARMQMAAVSGTVSSMFLYQNGSEQASAERWVEVDIEVLGKNPNQFQSNIITGKANAQVTSEQLHQVSPAATQAFHTYGIEWTPDYVRWTVDGKEVRKTTKGQNDNKNQVQNLIGTQGLRFNLWSSEDPGWVGNFDANQLPIFQFINWVKAYKYTPGQGPDGSDFTLDWTDNFDSFDASRWGKGDWTFDGNRVDLTDKNIYSKDGMLILALTRKGEEQFNGQVPKDDEPAPQEASSSSTPAQTSSSSSATQPVAASSSDATPASSAAQPVESSSSTLTPVIASSSSSTVPGQQGIIRKPTEHSRYNIDLRHFNAKGAKVNKADNEHIKLFNK